MAKPMPITGRVLEWALGDRNIRLNRAADELGVAQSAIESWIDEVSQPNKGQLNALVKLLGCTPSFLFMPEPPATPRSGVVEFRKFPGAPLDVPPETAAAMETARTALRVAAWLDDRSDPTENPRDSVPKIERSTPPETAGRELRKWLGWSSDLQTGVKATESSAAKSMRDSLQLQGILVLHLTMDQDTTRGFSLHDDGISLVAVNTRDHVRARLFSYAHELAHLALRDDAVCLTRNNRGVEGYCNRVAAALLMPANVYTTFVRERLRGRVETRENVISIRNFFKVSLQAAAIRARTLGLATPGLDQLLESEPELKAGGGRFVPGNERTRPRIRVDQFGSGFVNSVLDAEEMGHLRHSQVLDLLRLSDQELDSARSLVSAGSAG